jgi:hypothetical protein
MQSMARVCLLHGPVHRFAYRWRGNAQDADRIVSHEAHDLKPVQALPEQVRDLRRNPENCGIRKTY